MVSLRKLVTRRAFALTTVLLLAAAWAGAVPVTYVDDDFNGATPGFGVTHFDSIPLAIAGTDPGGTVNVAAGNYTAAAPIVIPKALTILGPQADQDPRPSAGSLRQAGNADEASVMGIGGAAILFAFQASDITINGIEASNGLGDMLSVAPGDGPYSNIQILYCILHDSGDEAIQLRNVTDSLVAYNHIYDTAQDAINICCGSDNNRIYRNECHDSSSANGTIYIYDATNTVIEGNLVYNMQANDGVKLGNSNGSMGGSTEGGAIKDNIIHTGPQDGISCYMGGVDIIGNNIYNVYSSNGAIYIPFASGNIDIRENLIHDNGATGILVRANAIETSITINLNTIYNNSPFGVQHLGTTPLNAENNWWGDNSGPDDDAGVINGTGDRISLNVDADPWIGQSGPIINLGLDSDCDGLSDDEETYVYNTNPQDADSDDDGVIDGAEVALNTDPNDDNDTPNPAPSKVDDVDGDGFSDEYEIANGTDPGDGQSYPLKGDVNNTGTADFVDAVITRNVVLGYLDGDNYFPDRMDVNCDGQVTLEDSEILFNWHLSKRALIPCDGCTE